MVFMFFIVIWFFVKICCSSHWQIVLSLFFIIFCIIPYFPVFTVVCQCFNSPSLMFLLHVFQCFLLKLKKHVFMFFNHKWTSMGRPRAWCCTSSFNYLVFPLAVLLLVLNRLNCWACVCWTAGVWDIIRRQISAAVLSWLLEPTS